MNYLKNLDKKTKIYIGIGAGAILFLIFLLLILKMSVSGTISSKQFEKRLKDASIKYYEKYPEKLPKNSGSTVTITIDELVESGNLKDPKKLLGKVTCSGNVSVSNNNGNILYQPQISCSDEYETKLLYKRILDDNKVTTSGNGLYKMSDFYIFRGENLNNNVKFAGYNWQIVRINNDNTLKLLLKDRVEATSWDDRYNVERESTVGKNIYSISRIKDNLNEFFENLSNNDKALIVPRELCIGARNENSAILNDTIECSKKLDNQSIGLLQANEYILASLEPACKKLDDNQCSNYNYLTNYNSFWTITPDSQTTFKVYKVAGGVMLSNASSYAQPKPVVNITSNAVYKSGDGSEKNPYIIK